ncbi:hypothetical protein M2152_002226 [Microbacteriaceae bacterium SG_E_30_P1]|uniref:Uncharacterized protein n=1 Tax=Antiquaquibacter oligotrophicus TaxID=2880260 RepID=A0ABT6KQB4_9MICO|nr:hypothetical protein [Antiquaquibacter oligotrophicus]MDH6182044.1 hypothetical protein [Antiquaquibacter oligotrophicus]UDF12288.1 hypothetical protein LH407_08940 [Antiquaquibacter oligotrophicus]
MSKKIDSALKELKKALKKHAEVVGGPAVSLKKSQRASAKVAAAADAYAAAVLEKSGMPNPFTGMETLEASTIASLAAERDALKNRLTGPIDIAS